ncbi:hypothetical protein F0562_003517 [Nyssa sinensis]|uniref:Uncharacterized protein n=1 Tax=Nyssa sinensis TaxID=561372 RepID=A0A5J5BW97_9ASTE|nr:hypothetical protein F0562_003517 [Nyssa sinensis]
MKCRHFCQRKPFQTGESTNSPSSGLRKRFVVPKLEYRVRDTVDADQPKPVKLDAVAQAHIEKHRKLQEDLTDEMVGLAHQLKESSLMMSRSIQNTEKILDSTEKAIEHSLARTGHANSRSMERMLLVCWIQVLRPCLLMLYKVGIQGMADWLMAGGSQ